MTGEWRRLGLALMAGFAAALCPAGTAAQAQDAKPLRLLRIIWRAETGHEAGFASRLAELGYRIEAKTWHLDQDGRRLDQLLGTALETALPGLDYVYSFGTIAGRRTRTALAGRVPHLMAMVTDPAAAGAALPGSSVAAGAAPMVATSPYVRPEIQIEIIARLVKLRRMLVLAAADEPNSAVQLRDWTAVAGHRGVDLQVMTVPNRQADLDDLWRAHLAAAPKPDLVYLPLASSLVGRAARMAALAAQEGIATAGTSPNMMTGGGAAFSICYDHAEMGRMLADAVHRHRQGFPLDDPDVLRPRQPILLADKVALARHHITIPDLLAGQTRWVDGAAPDP